MVRYIVRSDGVIEVTCPRCAGMTELGWTAGEGEWHAMRSVAECAICYTSLSDNMPHDEPRSEIVCVPVDDTRGWVRGRSAVQLVGYCHWELDSVWRRFLRWLCGYGVRGYGRVHHVDHDNGLATIRRCGGGA